jgi:hypothetical protein
LEDQLLASLVTKDYVNTLGQAKAWMSAHIGLALVSVDGDEEFCPRAGYSKKDYARARFQYVTGNWYEPTIVKLYESYMALLDKQAEVLEEMENLYVEDRTIFMASPDSSKPKAASPEALEISELLDETQD